MNLSKRLKAVEKLLLPGNRLADIGCDHGYLCIDAVRSGLFSSATAADIHSGPLEKARENIEESQLNDRISCCLSDGFSSLEPNFDCAVICGMGGLLIRDILKQGKEKWLSAKQLLLGPHSETEELRKWILKDTPFSIFRECVVKDAGKYYVLLDVRPENEPDASLPKLCRDPLFIRYGVPSLQTDPELYSEYLGFLREKALAAARKISIESASPSVERRKLLTAAAEEIDYIQKEYLE